MHGPHGDHASPLHTREAALHTREAAAEGPAFVPPPPPSAPWLPAIRYVWADGPGRLELLCLPLWPPGRAGRAGRAGRGRLAIADGAGAHGRVMVLPRLIESDYR